MNNFLDQPSIKLPQAKSVGGFVKIPGSKSITNRALLIAMLAQGTTRLTNFLSSDDTKVVFNLFDAFNLKYSITGSTLDITGLDGHLPPHSELIYIDNAGTAARFLAAILCLGEGRYVIDGNSRMRQRPMADLISAMQDCGIKIKSLNGNGCPPLEIIAEGLAGGEYKINPENSSQYVSALLLSAPYAKNDTTIILQGELVSKPYVEMTMAMMKAFGVNSTFNNNEIKIKAGQKYQAINYYIEQDYSSASYFLALPAIIAGKLTIPGIAENSIQGDSYILTILKLMGACVNWDATGVTVSAAGPLHSHGDLDLYHCSDLLPTVAVLAAVANGRTHILNVANTRLKESDRISAMAKELAKLGIKTIEHPASLEVFGQGSSKFNLKEDVLLETYDDHRIAMSLSLLALANPQIIIENPACVAKTFPTFYRQLIEVVRE